MSYSPWDWADSFPLSAAACLIAGVPVVSKWQQKLDDVPTDAMPVMRRLIGACALGAMHPGTPEDPKFPRAKMLKTLCPEPPKCGPQKEPLVERAEEIEPTFSRDDLHEMTGWKVSRDELNRWVRAMGIPSAYDFGAPAQEGAGHDTESDPRVLDGVPEVAEIPAAPVVAESADDGVTPATPNWKMRIQAEATAFCLRLQKVGANPTKSSVLKPMTKWCVENEVRTDGNIFPSANYLRTHVLGGKHWDVPNGRLHKLHN